ncbi:helix-turn-helix domain-containing protein [Diplocloster hominis]|uniref:helix-turn-helix domain-containing protein n=1 Tax=Diplocloster hominis TaxID=3079010 RepID=UPI0031BA3BFB
MRQYKLLLQGFLMDRILLYRSANQFTQEQMAELLHISPRSYFDLEHGKYGLSALTLIFFLLILSKTDVLNLLDEFQNLVDRAGKDDVA